MLAAHGRKGEERDGFRVLGHFTPIPSPLVL